MKKYEVKPNHCRCHPETCCCRDWAIYSPDGEKHSTHFQKCTAEQFAALLNVEPVDLQKTLKDIRNEIHSTSTS